MPASPPFSSRQAHRLRALLPSLFLRAFSLVFSPVRFLTCVPERLRSCPACPLLSIPSLSLRAFCPHCSPTCLLPSLSSITPRGPRQGRARRGGGFRTGVLARGRPPPAAEWGYMTRRNAAASPERRRPSESRPRPRASCPMPPAATLRARCRWLRRRQSRRYEPTRPSAGCRHPPRPPQTPRHEAALRADRSASVRTRRGSLPLEMSRRFQA